jgi:Escherichia/Staphylococcus phage prohead protease
MKREIRFAGAALRASKSNGAMVITGRPAVYNSLSQDLGGFKEVLLPGCFDDSLSDQELYAAWNHDDSQIIGRVSAGTLEVDSDRIGLTMRCTLPNSPLGQNVYESIRRGDVKQMSFGMVVIEDRWDIASDNNGQQRFERRSISKANLFEVSPVTNPAYTASSVSARSLFPDGQPTSRVERVEVDERSLAHARACLELAKRR